MSYEIGNPQMLWLLLFAPVALALMAYSGWNNRRSLAKFGSKPTAGRSIRGIVSAILLICGIVFLAIGCADVRWGKTTREVPQKGLEVVFALDVSRSMLAEDARPNRLARAKQQITDMVGAMVGDRIGLVVFAGEAKQAVPLTNHYTDFREKLESVGPHSVPTGGSQLGVAIQAAADAFISKTSDHKTIVLFTDGEDQESKPVELAEKLNAENELRIFTVGLGDMDKGARIPQNQDASGQFVEHQGQQIWSKLNGSVLRKIATKTQAAYIPAGTKRVNMADVYHRYIGNLEKSEFETAKINAFVPRFQWFAFPAFACLLLHGWLASSGIRQNSSSATRSGLLSSSTPLESPSSKRSGSAKSKVAATVAMLIFLPSIAHGQSTSAANQTVAAKINAANELVRQNDYSQAIEDFNAIEATEPNDLDALNYNLAVAHYGNSDFDAALTLLAESAKSSNDRIATDSRYNIGNCHFAKSLPLAQQPEASIQQLELAVEHYRSAIRLDRQHADARENLERAKKLIEKLKQDQQSDQQQNQPKQEQKDQQKQDNEQSDDSDQEEQEDQPEESEQSQENQEQTGSDEKSSEESDSQSDEEQSSGEDQSQEEETQNEQTESTENSDSKAQSEQPSEEQSDDASNQSQDAQQQQNDGQADEDSQQNDAAAEEDGKAAPQGEVTAANESQSEDTKDANENTSLSAAEQIADDNGVMSRQEALKLLQAVRDRDMIRRLRQQQRERSRRVQVEKDW